MSTTYFRRELTYSEPPLSNTQFAHQIPRMFYGSTGFIGLEMYRSAQKFHGHLGTTLRYSPWCVTHVIGGSAWSASYKLAPTDVSIGLIFSIILCSAAISSMVRSLCCCIQSRCNRVFVRHTIVSKALFGIPHSVTTVFVYFRFTSKPTNPTISVSFGPC